MFRAAFVITKIFRNQSTIHALRLEPKISRKLVVVNSNNRFKYTAASKFKESKKSFSNRNSKNSSVETTDDGSVADFDLDNDNDYDLLVNSAMNVTRKIQNVQNVFIIQPYVKWGPKKTLTKPELKLQEAEALIRSLPRWNIEYSLKVPLESLDKRTLFGTGKLEEIKGALQQYRRKQNPITCVFISKGTLSFTQKHFLEQYFGVPIMDRYSIVIQILRLHATSTEAKLQVSMAEIPYIWSQMKETDAKAGSSGRIYISDTQKQMLRLRERKIKHELNNVRAHRELLRNKRKQKNYPVVAVVGYTNAGKTSLIKALTDEQKLQPKNQLFATLDVTAHAGLLPCNLEVLYMDTVGFMSDIPTGLIECFVATLEDAMLADIIIHVQDVSHENYLEQKEHVENTLKSLIQNTNRKCAIDFIDSIINVGNKIDLFQGNYEDLLSNSKNLKLISSTKLTGVNNLLSEVENKILKITDRKKITIRVPMGGPEMSWLYKNAAITASIADQKDNQQILLNVVITNAKLYQFKHYFLS